MKRRQFMLVLGAGGAAIALPACDTMPANAIAPWNGPGATESDPRPRALSWAMLAPNPHNLQSWMADVREPGLIKLHVDRQRLLPQTDPPNRQILIGCDAFLELLSMAASYEGWRAVEDSIKAANHTYTWVWLTSQDNSRRSQLESGRAYMRVDLAAAALGLAIQPSSQVLQEFEQMRELYRDFHREVEVTEPARVQMLARLGYAERPNPAPRRAMASVVRA